MFFTPSFYYTSITAPFELALPEAVVVRENGFKAVKYEQMSALIIQAIKELSDKVDTLESKLNGI